MYATGMRGSAVVGIIPEANNKEVSFYAIYLLHDFSLEREFKIYNTFEFKR
jgi:hypothetical protein